MNKKIIKEFIRLISFIQKETDEFKKINNKKEIQKNYFRLNQLNNILKILENYPVKITLSNYEELIEISGIGKHTIERIKEILINKKLSICNTKKIPLNFKLKDSNQDSLMKYKIIKELKKVIGIGPNKALELYNQNIKGVTDLKNKIKKNKISVNDKIKLGLKYHGIYKVNIPKKEIDKIYKILKKLISKMNKKYKLKKDEIYCIEICGSYRREKPYSNDIDLLLTKFSNKKNKEDNEEHLKILINELKKGLDNNNNKPFLVDDITDKNIITKYMGFCKYKKNPIRRIDIRYVPYKNYPYALLYFTGSKEFNKKIRKIAKSKGYKLSEYGLFDSDNNIIKVKNERDIFRKLSLEYLSPRLR